MWAMGGRWNQTVKLKRAKYLTKVLIFNLIFIFFPEFRNCTIIHICDFDRSFTAQVLLLRICIHKGGKVW